MNIIEYAILKNACRQGKSQDTSQNANSLPTPPTAAVGQIIVVSAVDNNGKVTATEAVTLADAEEVAF